MKKPFLSRVIISLGALFATFNGYAQVFDWVIHSNGPSVELGTALKLGETDAVYTGGTFNFRTDFKPGPDSLFIQSYSTTITNTDAFVAKYDTSGKVLWAKGFIGAGDMDLWDLCLDKKENVYSTGSYVTSCDFDPDLNKDYFLTSNCRAAFISKLDSSGNFVFAKQFKGCSDGMKIIMDNNNDLIIGGRYSFITDFNPDPNQTANRWARGGLRDGFICKLDSVGNFKWVNTFNGPYAEEVSSVASDINGNIFVVGNYEDSLYYRSNQQNLFLSNHFSFKGTFLSKLDSNGNILWLKKVAESTTMRTHDICLGPSGEIYIGGEIEDTVYYKINGLVKKKAGFDEEDIFIAKIDSNGNTEWLKTIDGKGTQKLGDLDIANNKLLFAGRTDAKMDFDSGEDSVDLNFGWLQRGLFFVEYDLNGNYSWARVTNSYNYDYMGDIQKSKTASIYSTGGFGGSTSTDFDPGPSVSYVNSTTPQKDFFLHKMKPCDRFVDTTFYDICKGDSVLIRNSVYKEAGIFREIIFDSTGCDTTLYFAIKINPTFHFTNTKVICQGDSILIHGEYQKKSAIYSDTLSSMKGCDSIESVELVVEPKMKNHLYSICEGDSILIHGIYRSTSGVYTDTAISINGCDSISSVSLKVDSTDRFQAPAVNICQRDSALIFGSYRKIAGIYRDSLQSISGCDSIITVHLQVDSIDLSVQNNSPTLIANANNSKYQWLDCNNNYSTLINDTNQTFVASANGSYAVEVQKNGCVDTSECYQILTVGEGANNNEDNQINVFPNPTNNFINISFSQLDSRATIELRNVIGKLILIKETITKQNRLRIEGAKGIYFLKISMDDEVQTFKIIKIERE